jgi:gliding motility-associated-like protein
MKRLIYNIILICFALAAKATHIVGGDVTYQHLSQKEYRVTLHLYIDCINGTAGAINLDTVANISYFDAKTNTLLSYDPLSLLTKINVEKVNYKCLKAEPNACVQQFTFSYVKIIEPSSNGVIIAFQRCCRNRTITNLINPEDVGATFFALVPPSSLVSNNSSAVFKNLPPNFLCTNAPLVFDHSAADADGDSLVYSLILPYNGAAAMYPRPVPANNPPFDKVIMSGSYGVSNMMNGSVLLQIDPITGVLRVTPSDAGQFVVAVKVEEYRNGVKINEGFRDYQLNVIDCEIDVIANFTGPDISCDREIYFDNLSLGESLRYSWDFGELDQTQDISSDKQGHWIYTKEGTFMVQLLVYNDACKDTFSKPITIVAPRYIYSRFSANPTMGCDSLTVLLENKSDSASSFEWDLGDGSTSVLNKEVTQYSYNTPGKYTITLMLTDSNTCNIKDDSSVQVEILESRTHDVDFSLNYKTGCSADGLVRFMNVKNTPGMYEWNISDGTEWSNQNKLTHKFKTKGFHTIKLRSTDTAKCVTNDTITKEIYLDEIEPATEGIVLYNVFTPGDDEHNNCFTIDIEKANCINLRYAIYNRWGELVYEGNNVSNCWNGTDYITGKDVPEGEYFGVYLFKINGEAEELRLSNVISLLRK